MKQGAYKRQIILGLFTLIGIVILMLGILTIGNQQKVFAKTMRILVVFDDVEGLQSGNNIWLSGVKIGTVRKLEFRPDHRVEVLLDIGKEAWSHIHQDARAKISTDGLIGNRIVVIEGGSDSSPVIRSGDILSGIKTVKTDDMLATLQQNNKNLLTITGELSQISHKINAGAGTAGMLLNDPELAGNFRQTIRNLELASVNSVQVTRSASVLVKGLHQPGGLIDKVSTDTIFFSNLQETARQLRNASTVAGSFLHQLQLAGVQLNNPGGTAGMLLRDSTVAGDLSETIRHLRTSSEKLDEDLEALQHNFLLRGFFKNKAKKEKEAGRKTVLQHDEDQGTP